jgi:hypothetical protein
MPTSILNISPNPIMAERHLRLLYTGARGHLAIVRKQGGRMIPDFFDLLSIQMNNVAERGCSLATRHDVYFGVGLQERPLQDGKRGDAESVIAMPGFVADIDIQDAHTHAQGNLPPNSEAAMVVLRASGLEPSIIVQSGHGLHGYWLFSQPLLIDPENRERVKRAAANLHAVNAAAAHERGWKIDNVSDLARILRLAGTVNWKDPENPKLVTFKYTNNRYEFGEIEELVGKLTVSRRGSVGFEGFGAQSDPDSTPEPVEPAAIPQGGLGQAEGWALAGPPGETEDFPPAKIEPIINGCAWMRHCKEDAEALPEPEWYGMLSVAVRCEDGENLVHELSEPYPKYTPVETARKARHAREAAGPITCETVIEKFGPSYCDRCDCRGLLNSPITLGTIESDPVVDQSIADGEEAADSTKEADGPGVSVGSSTDAPQASVAATAPADKPAPPTAATATQWPDPKPLKTLLPPVPAFDPELLPGAFREYALDVSDRMQVPLD